MKRIELTVNEIKKYITKAFRHGKKTKQRACVELALSLRQMNRLLNNYVQFGKPTFPHENKKHPQSRLPANLEQHSISTIEETNHFLINYG
ncbi:MULTISPECIES: hypothetical protein [unclassified Granulicatella]|uniref:hypothetical protein n=1 Tax=unclassified Granulicatella TaxID=2630493 RepID=UPI0010738F69|nr:MULTISPECIES: hypothetical protein [unclassified Granulicatella]MBF0780643.1 hypothetical protein [Granulicatella sp. 19428wC4_WM01]TFU94572.1 hypothetical protein E4T68_05995 [Granulicatella sp. WM01]